MCLGVAEGDEPSDAQGQGDQAQEPDEAGGHLEEGDGRGDGQKDQDDESDHLAGGDPTRPGRRCGGHHGHGHDGVVHVGTDERQRGDPDFGRKAGHHRETRQPSVRAGMAGPNGWSPRRVTRWAKRGVSP